jgi:hypothetical protein
VNRFFTFLLVLLIGCSPKVVSPDPESLKPVWLKSHPALGGYYIGIGHSNKIGNNNYIQAAKKSALDDLVSQIKVNISSTSVLSQLEIDKQFSEQYEQIIQTTTADEIEDFEIVDTWEDASNYWVYYRLSISRYRQIKEEQKRNATLLATDYFSKARSAESSGENLQAIAFYFQALRAMEKHLGDAIRVPVDGRDILLVNEIYASLQSALNRITLLANPAEINVNRRIQEGGHSLLIKAAFSASGKPIEGLPLNASFEKGAGDIFPSYKTNAAGESRILLNKISSKEIDQSINVRVDLDALSNAGKSEVYALILKTLKLPRVQINLKVERPLVFLSSDEKSFGLRRSNSQLSNRLRNLLATNGFEFTNDKSLADLWFDVRADAEKGSITGSIYVTYLTGLIKVMTVREGKEIYATVLDRIKGFGLDYDKSSIDAYNKAMETLEKEKMNELINTVLQ